MQICMLRIGGGGLLRTELPVYLLGSDYVEFPLINVKNVCSAPLLLGQCTKGQEEGPGRSRLGPRKRPSLRGYAAPTSGARDLAVFGDVVLFARYDPIVALAARDPVC